MREGGWKREGKEREREREREREERRGEERRGERPQLQFHNKLARCLNSSTTKIMC